MSIETQNMIFFVDIWILPWDIIMPPFYSGMMGEDIIPPPPPPVEAYLLQENGYALLNQSGGYILLE